MAESKLRTWLREAMRLRGYDPEPRSGGRTKLAEDAGLAVPTISRMLDQNGVEPGIETLRRIASVLGYDLGEALAASGLADPAELPVREAREDDWPPRDRPLRDPESIAIVYGAIAGLQARLEIEDDPEERRAIQGAIAKLIGYGGSVPPPPEERRPGRRAG